MYIYLEGQRFPSLPPKNLAAPDVHDDYNKQQQQRQQQEHERKRNYSNIVILGIRKQLTILHTISRGINSEYMYAYFLMQISYIKGTFKIWRGDTNFGVSYERSQKKEKEKIKMCLSEIEFCGMHKIVMAKKRDKLVLL